MNKLNFQDIKIGNVYEFERQISQQDLNTFAKLSGDFNPLHMDKEYGQKSKFGSNIVPGMLSGALFSALVGMYCPGEKSLYLSQTLYFRKPIFPNDKVKVRGTVINKNDNFKLITIKTEIFKDDILVINGEAKVSFLK